MNETSATIDAAGDIFAIIFVGGIVIAFAITCIVVATKVIPPIVTQWVADRSETKIKRTGTYNEQMVQEAVEAGLWEYTGDDSTTHARPVQ